jgi:hypothetical protein
MGTRPLAFSITPLRRRRRRRSCLSLSHFPSPRPRRRRPPHYRAGARSRRRVAAQGRADGGGALRPPRAPPDRDGAGPLRALTPHVRTPFLFRRRLRDGQRSDPAHAPRPTQLVRDETKKSADDIEVRGAHAAFAGPLTGALAAALDAQAAAGVRAGPAKRHRPRGARQRGPPLAAHSAGPLRATSRLALGELCARCSRWVLAGATAADARGSSGVTAAEVGAADSWSAGGAVSADGAQPKVGGLLGGGAAHGDQNAARGMREAHGDYNPRASISRERRGGQNDQKLRKLLQESLTITKQAGRACARAAEDALRVAQLAADGGGSPQRSRHHAGGLRLAAHAVSRAAQQCVRGMTQRLLQCD